jgi:O-antigen/teichoic acid export membrane protein
MNSEAPQRTSVARNAAIVLFNQVAPSLAAVVCVPYLVHAYGTDRIGVLSLLLVTVGYFALLDLGLSKALTRTGAEALSLGQDERIPGMFWTALTVQSALGAVGGLGLAAAAPFLVEHVLNIPEALHGEARASLMLAAASLPVVIATSAATGLLQAARRFDQVAWVQVPVAIANYLLPLVFALFTHNLAIVMAGIVVTRMTSLALMLWQAHRSFPALSRRRAEWSELQPLLRFGGWIALVGVLAPLLVYADRLVIGASLEVASVAYYSIPADLASRLLVVPAALSLAVFPVFSAGSAQRAPGQANAIVAQSFKYILCSVGLPAVLVSAFAHDALALWIGEDFAAHAAMPLRVLLLSIVINGLGYVPMTLVQARGRPELAARLHLIELPLYLLAIWLGMRQFGLAGVALAAALRVSVDSAVLFAVARRIGPLSGRALLASGVGAAAALVACTWFAALLATLPAALSTRLLCGGAVGAVALLVAWCWVLDPSDRARVLVPLQSRWRGLSGAARP